MKEERKNNKIYYGSIIIAIIIILSIGVSYAWFTSVIVKNPNLVTNGTLQIKYTEGSNINASNLKPATTAQVLEAYKNGSCIYKQDREQGITNEHICAYNTFTITNTGTLYAKTDISIKNIINTYSSNIKYMLFENTPEELTINNLKGVIILEKNILIPPKTNNSKTYTLLIWLDENADNYDFNKEYSGNIYAEAIETNMPNLDKSKANKPVLAEGMIPIYYNEELDTWVKADNNNEDEANQWYDYQNKMWANAVMVKSDKRDTYMSAINGTVIPEDDILAYYVWIPRYKYQLFNVDFIGENYSYDYDADGYSTNFICTANCPQVIDVVFEKGIATTGTTKCQISEIGVETCTNKENGNWYTHPAFTFGDTELEGIWVGKFETTGTADSPTIKPNISSLVDQNVSTQFITSQKFSTNNYLTTNGLNKIDSHMMKNIEWGAVAYLKQSNYGLGLTDMEVCGIGNAPSCENYTTKNSMMGSTTGNVYGVYDMNGGEFDAVMGVMQDNTSSRSPMSGYDTDYNSGYLGKVGSPYTDSGNTLTFPNAKYYDLYANGTSFNDYTRSHLGDATGETAGWYFDAADFVNSDLPPWFVRGGGGDFKNFQYAGIFCYVWGHGGNGYAFRVVLSVTE